MPDKSARPQGRDIVAIVTTNRDLVGGSAPIFYASSPEEATTMVWDLGRSLRGDVIQLKNGVYVLISPQP